MKIKITTQSDTLFGTASGGALVDSTTRHDKYGFPVIPAKTLKGLLRESAQEVLELTEHSGLEKNNNKKHAWLEQLFGKEGVGGQGRISIQTAQVTHLKDQEFQRKEVEENRDILPEEALDYFTRIRYQTAIDDLGIANKGSLRSARVLQKGVTFESEIDGLNGQDQQLIYLACLNLRRAGTNRNRGWGHVKTELISHKTVNIDDALEVIKQYKPEIESGNDRKAEMPFLKKSNENGKQKTRTYKITFQSPVLLPIEGGDANTVSAAKVIPGRKILGMLAGAYLQKNGNERAETNAFAELFLNGNTKYSAGFPYQNENAFFPLGNHWSKPKSKKPAFSDYDNNGDHGNSKGLNGLYSKQGKKASSVATTLDFHNSRNADANSRVTGKNQGDGIYYYEAIAAGQSFYTEIKSEEDHLAILESLMKTSLRLGKAAHTQYGQVQMERLEGAGQNEQLNIEGQNVIITLTTPALLKNRETGEYNPSLQTLNDYLGDVRIVSAKDCRFRTQPVKVFQGKIKMQLPEALALGPGSSFQLKNLSPEGLNSIESWVKNGIGEATHEGYGQVIIETQTKNEDKKDMIQTSFKENVEAVNEHQEKGDIPKSDNPILEHIRKSRLIRKVQKNATDDAGENGMHKNTVTLMIKFWKDVLNQGDFEQKKIQTTLTQSLLRDIPKKPLEILSDKLNTKLEAINRKESEKVQKENGGKLAEKMLTSFKNKFQGKDQNNWELIATYWLAFFTKKKINNR